MDSSALAWSREEFGAAELGDTRRAKRLVELAAVAASRPAGTVSGTFALSAQREGAFRFLENDAIDAMAIGDAFYKRTAARCEVEQTIIVAVDQAALSTVRDRNGIRGFGPISSPHRRGTGINVMSALAVTRDGVPLGLLDQKWWVRPQKPHRILKSGSRHDPRAPEERESDYWLRTMRASLARLAEHAPGATPWFQLDRGGDCHCVLAFADEEKLLLTVRSRGDRLVQFVNGRQGFIRPVVAARSVAGHYYVDVPARPGRKARLAKLAVRFMPVPVALRVSQKSERRKPRWFNAVMATEVCPPRNEAPISWLLLTTHEVENVEDALQVVAAYTLRWRLEDFHKTWKSGSCDIEESQLRARDHFQRWATIMAAVAARIERLKHLARQDPERPATDAYTQDEIDAALLLRNADKPDNVRRLRRHTPTLGEMTLWVAQLGGHMGSKPAGSIVLRRGLELVAIAAATLQALRASSGNGRSGQS